MAATSRTQVRQGIAAYFGGTYQTSIRAYQNGPLLSAGLATVRAGWGKRLNMKDYVNLLPAGRGMGAYMIVSFKNEDEGRLAIGGPPVTDGGGNLISGGIRSVRYQVTLWVFHLAQTQFAEDAQQDIDELIEAIKNMLRVDRTLGMPGIITQAGEGRFGIKTEEGQPVIDGNDRTATWFTIRFECLAQIVA